MRKGLKIVLYIVCSILLVVLMAIVYLNTPWGQNFVRVRAQAYLRNKLKTEVSIGHLGYGLPKYIVLNDVLVLDQSSDTLASVAELKIDINMLRLLRKEVDIQKLLLSGAHAHIYRNRQDTDFNFTYIINAFTGKPDPNKVKDTTPSSLHIDLDRVVFNDIHFRFDDHAGGNLFALNLANLDLSMKKLDLDKMLFHIKSLSGTGLSSSFAIDTAYLKTTTHDATQTNLTVMADDVDLNKVSFQFTDELNAILFNLNLGNLQLALNKFVLQNNLVDIKKLSVNNTAMAITMGKHPPAPAAVATVAPTPATSGASTNWRVRAGEIKFAAVNFNMDDDNSPRQPQGIDYAHLKVQDLALDLAGLFYNSDTISGNLKHLAAKEQSGVDVRELRTVFNYNPQGAILQNLFLQTPYSLIQDHLEAHYPSLTIMQKHMETLQLNVNISRSVIGLKDVLIFAPQLSKQDMVSKYRGQNIKVDANVTGLLNNLNIGHLVASGMDSTEVSLTGTLKGLPDENKVNYNLNIIKLLSSRSDVEQMVPDTLLSSVRLPDRFGFTGHVSGTVKDYTGELYFASTDGFAYIKGSLATSPGAGQEKYDVLLRTNGLDIGRILRQDSLIGKATATIVAKGVSLGPKTMDATIDGEVASAYIKGYRYHDLKWTGKLMSEKGNIIFSAADTNFQLQLTGQFDFSGRYPSARADIRLDSIDFQALKLYSSDFRARGLIHLDFPSLNPDYPQGAFTWWKPIINAGGYRYYLDSMYVVSRPSADTGQNIVANLDVMQATITGKTPLTKIVPIIEQHINRHYNFRSPDSAMTAVAPSKPTTADTTQLPADYGLNLKATIVYKPMLHGLLPGLTSFDPITVDGSLTPQNLAFNATAPNTVYGSASIENVDVKVRGADSSFTYNATIDKITSGNMALYFADIHGNLDKDSISSFVSLSDVAKKERFALAATLHQAGDSQVVHLKQGLKLNYKTWSVAAPNRMVIAKGGFFIQDFEVSDSNQSIKAASDEARVNAPLKVTFTHFLLSDITDVISHNDTLLADGVVDGNVAIRQMSPALQLTAALQIKGLSMLGDTLGDVDMEASNKQADAIDAKIALKGHGNDIALDGSYFLKENNGNDFNAYISVNALAVHSFEALAMDQIRNSSGYLRGKLQVQGTPSAPAITGELHTDNLTTTVSQLNAVFRMPSEKITFSKNEVTLNNFTIHDSADNKAVFNGNINIADLSDMKLDMKVTARDWRAVNATRQDNGMFYGKLLLSSDLTIKGPVSAPSVDGTLKILKGTDMTIVNPETGPQMQDAKGIVIFENMKDTGRENRLIPKRRDATEVHKMTVGADFNVNITIDKAAQFSLVIDQASGDFLSVQGEASINASVNPGGTLSLSGSYELHGGAYQLNYNFIKRKFNIKDGSVITFAGDPVTGTNLDVTAQYEAQAPPYDLVEQEFPSDAASQAQLNYYKQNLPFLVDLHMNGPVLLPHLSFDVELPENKVYPLSAAQLELVQGRLAQVRADTSELNKQVFAVLILGRFVSEDPFSSGASTSNQVMVLQSVSTFIGEQLNQAAGKLVKGVDLSVDLAATDDYTSGTMQQRTDLNVAASKQLLNNRLKLTIGNDFELQGPQASNDPNSVVPTNLAADYLLTEDGRYTLRGYRRVYDEGVLEGYVTETGLDFIVNLNFNKFRDVFKKSAGEKADTTTIKK